jgi:hypothetical protein
MPTCAATTRSSRSADRGPAGSLCRGRARAGTLWPTAPFVRVEDSPSPVYGAALLMRLGFTALRGSNPRSSAARRPSPGTCRDGACLTRQPKVALRVAVALIPGPIAPRSSARSRPSAEAWPRGCSALGCRHSRVAKHLLGDADVHALLDKQRRGGMPGVMDPGIPNPGLPEDRLPRPASPRYVRWDRHAAWRRPDRDPSRRFLPATARPPVSCGAP